MEIQKKFKIYNDHVEWFIYSDKLMEFIALNCSYDKKYNLDKDKKNMNDILKLKQKKESLLKKQNIENSKDLKKKIELIEKEILIRFLLIRMK